MKIVKQMGEGFAQGKLYDVLVDIATDLAEIKAKYENHRHGNAGAAGTGKAPTATGAAAADTASEITVSMPSASKIMARGFAQGELSKALLAIKTDLDGIKTKYEDHRHSAVGDASTGTKPSTAAGTAGDTASTVSVTSEARKPFGEGFGRGHIYTLLKQIKVDLTDFKTKYEAHRHSAAGASPTGTAPSTAAATADATASTITLTIDT